MEFTAAEKLQIERSRVLNLLEDWEPADEPTVDKLASEYTARYKAPLQCFKAEFASVAAFLKYSCNLIIGGDGQISQAATPASSPGDFPASPASTGSPTLQYVSRPQFSPFYGFSEAEKGKGVPYRVWRFEVESTLRGGLYSDEVISEQIRRSLYGEAKTKVVGFGPEVSCDQVLLKLDQFYSDVGAVTGDELLTEAYAFKQKEKEEVAAFASRLDNHVRLAKHRGTELLPDEEAVERQLRMLFWAGLKEEVKDKARHRKDSCTSFSALITAARYAEKEAASSAQTSKHVAHSNPVMVPETPNPASKPTWLAEVCSAMAREVRDALADHVGGRSGDTQKSKSVSGHRAEQEADRPVCYRCGQIGHIAVGCRNSSAGSPKKPSGNDRRSLPWGNQRS